MDSAVLMAVESPFLPTGVFPVTVCMKNEDWVNNSIFPVFYRHNTHVEKCQVMRFIVVKPMPLLEPLVLKPVIYNPKLMLCELEMHPEAQSNL